MGKDWKIFITPYITLLKIVFNPKYTSNNNCIKKIHGVLSRFPYHFANIVGDRTNSLVDIFHSVSKQIEMKLPLKDWNVDWVNAITHSLLSFLHKMEHIIYNETLALGFKTVYSL